MSRPTKLMLCFIVLLSVMNCLRAEIINTYTATASYSWQPFTDGGYVTQSFVVPEGQELTSVSFYINDSGYDAPGAYLWLHLYQGYYGLNEMAVVNLVDSIGFAADQVPTVGYITLSLSTPLPADSYYLQLWSNDATYNSKLKGLLYTGSEYPDGRASRGEFGTLLLGETQDFMARITTRTVPDPEPVYALRNGRFTSYQFGNDTPFCWAPTTESGVYTFAREISRTFIQNAETAVSLEAVTPGHAYYLQSISLPPGDYAVTADIHAPSPAVARLAADDTHADISTSGWEQQSINFSPVGNNTDIKLGAAASGKVHYRRVSLEIQQLVTAAVPFSDGSTLGRIMIATTASDSERFAAFELQNSIYKITGLTPALDGRDVVHSGRTIYIGSAASGDILALLDGLDPDAYIIHTDPAGNIALAGRSDRATLYAAYDFLKIQGCRWYMPGPVGEVVPQSAALTLPDPHRIETPDYTVRTLGQIAHHYDIEQNIIDLNIEDYLDWCLRNRVNSFYCVEYPYTATFGAYRGLGHQQRVGHSYKRFLVDQHPEWWALVDGVRTKNHPSGRPNQICVANAELREFVINDARQFFSAHPNADAFALSANDYTCWCECTSPSCRALDSDGGTGPWEVQHNSSTCFPLLGMADRTVHFTNEILTGLNAQHPGKKIEVHAYAATQKPPLLYSANPNFLLSYTWHGAPVNKPISDTSYAMNLATVQELTGWQAAGITEFQLYDYGNYFYPDTPYFWFFHQTDYLKTFHNQWGFRRNVGEHDNSFESSPVAYNLRAQCYWDVDTHYPDFIRDFCTRFYGPGAEEMFEYHMFMERQQLESEMWQQPDAALQSLYLADYSVAVMEQGKWFLDRAWAKALGDPTVRHRIAYARMAHAIMTIQVAKLASSLPESHKIATARAFYLARQLARNYDMIIYSPGTALLQSLWFTPPFPSEQTWDRSEDWTVTQNPDDDSLGNLTWAYRYVGRGDSLDGATPWYQQPATDMVWITDHWQQTAATGPDIYNEYLQCRPDATANPIVCWTNTTGETLAPYLAGRLIVQWSAGTDPVDVEVVIAKKTAAGAYQELLAQTVAHPNPSSPDLQHLDIAVDLSCGTVDPDDQFLISIRPATALTAGAIQTKDDLVFAIASRLLPLVNGDFEDGPSYPIAPDGWGVNPGGIGKSDFPDVWGQPPNGSTYVCLFNSTATSQVIAQTVESPIQTGYTYALRADLCNGRQDLDPHWTTCSMQLWATDPGVATELLFNDLTYYVDFQNPYEWQEIYNEYTDDGTYAGWYLLVQFQFLGGWKPYLDDIRLIEISPTGATVRYCGDEFTVFLDADLTGPAGSSDCVVNIHDLAFLSRDWLAVSGPADIAGPDHYPDSVVDLFDLARLSVQWLDCSNPNPNACTTP